MLGGSVTADPAAWAAKAILIPRNSRDPPVDATPFRMSSSSGVRASSTTPSISHPCQRWSGQWATTPSTTTMASRTTSAAPAVARAGITP